MACGFGACFGCVVRTRRGYRRLCVDGPVVDAADLDGGLAVSARRAARGHRGSSSPGSARASGPERLRARSTRSPRCARSATTLRERFPFSAFVSKTITLEPRGRQPAAAAVGDAGRPDQLDRAAEQGPRGLPRARPAGAGDAAGAAGRERRRLLPRRVRAAGRGGRRRGRGRGARAERLVPERQVGVRDGLRAGRDGGADGAACARSPTKPLIVKLTPNVARRRCRSRAAARGRRRRRAVADQHAARDWRSIPRTGRPWLGAGQRRSLRSGGPRRRARA